MGWYQRRVHGQATALKSVFFFDRTAADSACEKGSHWQTSCRQVSHLQATALKSGFFDRTAANSACEKGSQWQTRRRRFSQRQTTTPGFCGRAAADSAYEKGTQWQHSHEQFWSSKWY